MIEQVLEPESLDEALALLRERADEARVLAGGQSLLVLLRHGLLDTRTLIALRRVPELAAMTPQDGGLRVGATVTQRRLEDDPQVARRFPALRDAARAVANPQVRNKGTLGGNLCHADPSADPPAALIALGARVELARAGRVRTLAAEALFTDFLATAVEPDELLTAVTLPPPEPGGGSAYLKHSLREVDPAIVGVGVWLQVDERGVCRDARVGLGGVGLTPLRAPWAEAALRGSELSDAALGEAGEIAAAECEPLDDLDASAWYRRKMVRVHLERAARLAASRAGILP